MTWGLVAVAGATLVGGTIAASNSSSAAKQAAQTQAQASDQAAQVNREGLQQQQKQFDVSRDDTLKQYDRARQDTLGFYNTSRGDLAPYRDIGSNALTLLANELGVKGPGGDATGVSAFRKDPGYQFAMDEGARAVDSRFTGMSRSGAKMKALDQFGQGIADQGYSNWLARLSGLASVGQTATGQSASLGAGANSALSAASPTNALNNLGQANASAIGNYSANAGNLLQNSAAARASGYVGSANAANSAIGGGVNNLLSLYGMSGGFGGFGGSSLAGQTSGPAMGWT